MGLGIFPVSSLNRKKHTYFHLRLTRRKVRWD